MAQGARDTLPLYGSHYRALVDGALPMLIVLVRMQTKNPIWRIIYLKFEENKWEFTYNNVLFLKLLWIRCSSSQYNNRLHPLCDRRDYCRKFNRFSSSFYNNH